MLQFPKIYLLLSSISCLWFSSCAVSKYNKLKDCEVFSEYNKIAPIASSHQTTKYNTTIDVLKNHLTGIVVVKHIDSSTTRIVFVTELGMKMFDFEAKKDSINALYVFEPLNKPALINVLKDNFKNIFLLNTTHKPIHQCVGKDNETILSFVLDNKQKAYLKPSTFIQQEGSKGVTYYIGQQETFHNKKLNSRITYYNISDVYFSKIIAKQYGLIKFYFELNRIPE